MHFESLRFFSFGRRGKKFFFILCKGAYGCFLFYFGSWVTFCVMSNVILLYKLQPSM
jgi:hypothetical protein